MTTLSTNVLDIGKIRSMGAEAKIYEGRFLGFPVICKMRIPKSYRDPSIDAKLRKERTVQEVRILNLAHNHELPVPRVLDVDKRTWTIVMEKVMANSLKEHIVDVNIDEVFSDIGRIIANLHNLDIIHGDLTTSNILYRDGYIWLIDFGLGFISTNIEDRAVDLLVLKHTLESSHSDYADIAFDAIMTRYLSISQKGDLVQDRLSTVENRVRYRSHTMG